MPVRPLSLRSPLPTLPLRVAFLALLAFLVAVAAPSAAEAKHGQATLFDTGGRLLSPGLRDETFTELEGLGVTGIRIQAAWRSYAPDPDGDERPSVDLGDPASYDFSQLAAAVDGAKARGWKVVLTLTSPVPRWGTEGARDSVTNPRASDFQHFVTAVGRAVPKVDYWAIWNEPNLFKFLMPQYLKGKPAAPTIYRNLFLAARKGLDQAGLPKAKMLMGETAPRGNGSDRIPPLAFLRGVLCLDAKYRKQGSCARLPADGYAHHPYTTPAGPFFVPTSDPDDVTMGAIGRLESALDKAAKAGRVKSKLPVFITEFGVQSYPDKSLGVPLDQQSDYRSIAERMAWNDPRIAAFSQYLLDDDQPAQGQPAARRYPGFESGLKTSAGKKKPAYEGFRLPLTAEPTASGVTLWGLVRPAHGATKLTVERADKGKSFKKLLTVTTKSDGSWTAKTSNRTGRTWRVVWVDAGGTTRTGPATKAYKDTR